MSLATKLWRRLVHPSQIQDGHTPWSRLAAMLNGPRHIEMRFATLETFIRLALIGYIPRRHVATTAEAMFDDLVWRHREKHGPIAATVGTVRDICREADMIERGVC